MIASPCINICKMDAASGLCLGCLRTLEEITLWARTDDSHRASILAKVGQRRQHPATAIGSDNGERHG